MKREVLRGGWIKQGSVFAFPYEWQRPVKTEEWVFETLFNKNVNSIFVEFISFPWATLIDLLSRGKMERASQLVSVLNELPPKKTLVRATACQHINPSIIEDLLVKINVTDLYWSHKTILSERMGVIRLHPMAIYPVAYFEYKNNKFAPVIEKKYLYSFVGAYDPHCYISSIRQAIFDLPENNRSFILKRNKWHFEDYVYKLQIEGTELDSFYIDNFRKTTINYINIMRNSVFSLCPSGSGPNSIRLWEALAFKCQPLVLSDGLDLPKNFYDRGFSKVKEKDLSFIIQKILDYDYEKNEQHFYDVDEFIENITSDLFDKEFLKCL